MTETSAPDFRTCRSSGCSCTVLSGETYCSEHCEAQARSAIRAGQGCECGHAECRDHKPPAV